MTPAMGHFCTWCGSTFEPQVTGRSVKKFCSTDCRQNFHAACRIRGEEAFGAGEVSIFQLQTCFARRARRTQCDLAPQGTSDTLEAGKRPGGPLLAIAGAAR